MYIYTRIFILLLLSLLLISIIFDYILLFDYCCLLLLLYVYNCYYIRYVLFVLYLIHSQHTCLHVRVRVYVFACRYNAYAHVIYFSSHPDRCYCNIAAPYNVNTSFSTLLMIWIFQELPWFIMIILELLAYSTPMYTSSSTRPLEKTRHCAVEHHCKWRFWQQQVKLVHVIHS